MSKHSKSKRAIQQGADEARNNDVQQQLNEDIQETKQEVQKEITLGGN
ncbi:hypothetical protein [Fictibacillus terranigra]|uniref:Uncharacterized protein n=1 Tax=Fictibacillus terranigra TaxID=3058424 RepID=A0ABT8E745_9BACL|nr:hypothetical protein [Fictibacillus sp. CENA-BCM004]MDN4073728.1 hypothetical protein [Fictibacillus sp. CENA-BCM004]